MCASVVLRQASTADSRLQGPQWQHGPLHKHISLSGKSSPTPALSCLQLTPSTAWSADSGLQANSSRFTQATC